jgi:oligoribonuclease
MTDLIDDGKMVWLDIETTGLEPAVGDILELGVFFSDFEGTVTNKGSYIFPLLQDEDALSPFILDMHGDEKSGLLREVAEEARWTNSEPMPWREQDKEPIYQQMQLRIIEWLIGIDFPFGAPMCGSSVHFDRAWLKLYLPDLEAMFGYRNIDISSALEVTRRRRPEVMSNRPKTADKHRVESDLEDTISGYRWLISEGIW